MKNFITFILLVSIYTFGQNNWHQLDSPGGANVNAIFKVTDSIFLVGVQDGSFYRSSDSGSNWMKVSSGNHPPNLGNKAVRCFTFNSALEILGSTYSRGILRSTDQGLTWSTVNGGGGEVMVNTESGIMFGFDNVISNWSLTKSIDSGKTWNYLPHNWSQFKYSMSVFQNNVYIGFVDSIIYSTDFGNSWSKYGNSFPAAGIHYILLLSENEIFAGTSNGVFYSSDSGITWHQRNSGIMGSSKLIRKLEVVSDRIYAVGRTGILYSTNKGVEWIHYNNYSFQIETHGAVFTSNLILAASYTGIFKVIPDGWLYSSQGIYSFNPKKLITSTSGNLYFNTSVGLFVSNDGGSKWNYIELEKFFGGCRDIIMKENYYFAQARSGLLYVSSDHGVNWVNTGSNNYSNNGMAFLNSGNGIFAGFYYFPTGNPPTHSLFYSSNFGVSWVVRYYHFPSLLTILLGDTIIASFMHSLSYLNLGLQRSSNLGFSWTAMNSGLSDSSVKSFAADNNNDFYTSSNDGIFIYNKADNEWNSFSNNSMNNVTSILFNKLNHCIVINNGKVYASVYGKRWDFCSEGIETGVSVIFSDSLGYFYVADNKGKLYKTLTPHLINQIPSVPELIYPIDNLNVIQDTLEFKWLPSSPLVMEYSVNISTDSTFTNFIEEIVIDTLLIFTNLDLNKTYYWRVRALNELGWGGYSNIGKFNTTVTDLKDDNEQLFEFSLSQNYPNPFNPSTKIKFSIPQAYSPLPGGARGGLVTLKVYDVLGREVATLVNEEKHPGVYEVEFDAARLASGIYYYQLKADSYIETKKMIYLK